MQSGNRMVGRTPREHPDLVRILHNLTFRRAARRAAREAQPDFIYERYSLWGVAGLRLARDLGVPLVLEVNAPLVSEQQQYRGLSFPALARRAERAVYRGADLLVAVSEPLGDHLAQAGADRARIRILPNAVDTSLFRPEQSGDAVRRRFGLEGRFVLGFAGSFKRWHGVDWLLEVFAELHQTDPSMHLLLAGDGPLRSVLEERVHRARLHDAVSFSGAVAHDEMPDYLAAMDVAVAPYPSLPDFYYSPLKLFEYMASGRAIAASRVGQIAEVIADGVTGLLFEPGDRRGFLDCICRLRHDAPLRRNLGRRASAACSGRTWKDHAARVIGWVEALGNHDHKWANLAAEKVHLERACK